MNLKNLFPVASVRVSQRYIYVFLIQYFPRKKHEIAVSGLMWRFGKKFFEFFWDNYKYLYFEI